MATRRPTCGGQCLAARSHLPPTRHGVHQNIPAAATPAGRLPAALYHRGPRGTHAADRSLGSRNSCLAWRVGRGYHRSRRGSRSRLDLRRGDAVKRRESNLQHPVHPQKVDTPAPTWKLQVAGGGGVCPHVQGEATAEKRREARPSTTSPRSVSVAAMCLTLRCDTLCAATRRISDKVVRVRAYRQQEAGSSVTAVSAGVAGATRAQQSVRGCRGHTCHPQKC